MYNGEAQRDYILKYSYIMHSMSLEQRSALGSQARSSLADVLDADPC